MEKYTKFLETKGKALGYCLFAERCMFDVLHSASGYSIVSVSSKSEKTNLADSQAVALFNAFSAAPFRFAGENAEYEYRNRHIVQIGGAQIESWVGRDLGRYVPGLYWLTGLSGGLAKRFGLYAFEAPRCGAVARGTDGSLVLRMEGRAADWKS